MIVIPDKIIGEIVPGISIDFAGRLKSGEGAQSGTVECVEAPTILANITPSGTKLICTLNAPAAIGTYVATLSCAGDQGSTRKATIQLTVVEGQ